MPDKVKNAKIKLKRKAATSWAARSDTLAFGEPTLVSGSQNDYLIVSNADNQSVNSSKGVLLTDRTIAPYAVYNNNGSLVTYANGSTPTAVGVSLPSNATAVTQTSGDSSTKIATTEFVQTIKLSLIISDNNPGAINTRALWIDISDGAYVLKFYDTRTENDASVYSASTEYKKGAVVKLNSSATTIYRCKKTSTGNDPSTSTDYFEELTATNRWTPINTVWA